MKAQLLVIALFSVSFSALTATQMCDCTEFTTSVDCSAGDCTWQSNDSTCTKGACTKYNTQTSCDNQEECAWTNDGKCADFTACADYSVDDGALCYGKNYSCVPGTAANGKTPCQTGTISCSSFTDGKTCNGVRVSATSMCYYHNAMCTAHDMSTCSGRKVQELCEIGCIWANDACAAPKCSDLPKDSCVSVFGDNFSSVTICAVSGDACAEAADVASFTADTCVKNSLSTYRWDGSVCVECTGSSSYSYLLGLMTILFMMMF